MSLCACISPIPRLSSELRRGSWRQGSILLILPYWVGTGSVTYRDPDGREVVFAPFVFGVNEPAVGAASGEHWTA